MSTAHQHTEGPWRVVDPPSPQDPRLHIIAGDGSWLAEVRNHDGRESVMRANAQMMAMAPTLRTALVALLDEAERHHAGLPLTAEEWFAVRDYARAAVQKAEEL